MGYSSAHQRRESPQGGETELRIRCSKKRAEGHAWDAGGRNKKKYAKVTLNLRGQRVMVWGCAGGGSGEEKDGKAGKIRDPRP